MLVARRRVLLAAVGVLAAYALWAGVVQLPRASRPRLARVVVDLHDLSLSTRHHLQPVDAIRLSPRYNNATEAELPVWYRAPAPPPRTAAPELRVLFLIDAQTYSRFKVRNFLHYFDAAARHPLVEAVLWGPGMPGFHNSFSLSTNLQRRFGSATYFHVVLLPPVVSAGVRVADSQVQELSKLGVCVAMREHESWMGRLKSSIAALNVTLLQLPYAIELHHYQEVGHRGIVSHVPHAALPELFARAPDAPRPIDVLLPGARHANVYPLRERLFRLVDTKRIRAATLKHVGYVEQGTFEFDQLRTPETWTEWHERNTASLDAVPARFAEQLQASKIVLVTSSSYRYALLKYFEAAMAGALVVGDLPNEMRSKLGKFVVALERNAPNDTIVSTIEYWLQHDGERIRRARIGHEIALREFKMDDSVELLLQDWRNWRARQWGTYYRHDYHMGCAAVEGPTLLKFSPHCGRPDAELLGVV